MRAPIAFLLLVTPAIVHAEPTKDECVDADTRAQTLRVAGKLRDARAQLEICSSQACPGIVRQDCTERLDDVMRASPTLIFDVKDAAGVDVASTRVTIDGQPLVSRLDGKSVSVDPGEHSFTFEAPGHPTATSRVLVHEGDKDRRVAIVLQSTAHTNEQPVEHREDTTHSSGTTSLSIILGSIALAGIGVGAGTGAVAITSWNASLGECSATACTNHDKAVSDHNTASDFATASTTMFIAGGLLAATAVIIFLVSRPAHKGVRVTGVGVGGTFP